LYQFEYECHLSDLPFTAPIKVKPEAYLIAFAIIIIQNSRPLRSSALLFSVHVVNLVETEVRKDLALYLAHHSWRIHVYNNA